MNFRKFLETSKVDAIVDQIAKMRNIHPDALKRLRTMNPEYLTQEVIPQIKQEMEKEAYNKKIQQAQAEWMKKVPKAIHDLPGPDWNEHGNVEDARNQTLTRYIWGNKEEIEESIKNGLKMNSSHGSLPKGWYYCHVGDEGWIATLARDYAHSGPVCEIEIFNLPSGFYLIDDLDIMDKTNAPSSAILISKKDVVPKKCVKVVQELDTEEIADKYPHITNEFPDG